MDLATGISTQGALRLHRAQSPDVFGGAARGAAQARFDVVAYDYGLKRSMLQFLVDAGAG